MKIRTLHILLLTVFIALSQIYKAQSETEQSIRDLYKVWNTHYSSYDYDHLLGSDSDAKELLKKQFTNSNNLSSFDLNPEIKSLEAELLGKDWGLNWRSGAQINSSPGLEVADNLVYRSRVHTEVSWNILNNGFTDNRNGSQIKFNESKILEFKKDEQSKEYEHLAKWQNIIYQFNQEKILLLDKKLALDEGKMKTVQSLHLQGKISQEEYLKNLEKVAETRSLIKVYNDYNLQLKKNYDADSSTVAYPLIDLDYSYLFNAMSYMTNDSIALLELENIDLSHKNNNDLSLRTFARYNAYNFASASSSNRSFFTFGLTFVMPIIFDKKTQAKLLELKKEEVINGDADQYVSERNGTLEYFYEFRYKLKQFHSFYYKRLIFIELLRKEQARYDIDRLSFNPVYALRLLEDLISIDIELVDIKQQMYLKALNIYTSTPYAQLDKMIQKIEPDQDLIEDAQSAISSIYVWSKTFSKYSYEYLNNYFNLEKINTVVVSLGADFTPENVQKVNQLYAQGYNVELMIGNNKLLFEDLGTQLEKLNTKLEGIKFSTIHLDIEPHALDDWKTNKEKYSELYLNMLDAYKAYCTLNGLRLNASIPLHYSEEFKTQIISKIDVVYYMCYENIKTEYIQKKILQNTKPFVIALRTEDFSDRIKLEEKASSLKSLLNPQAIIVHDLRRLIEFKTE